MRTQSSLHRGLTLVVLMGGLWTLATWNAIASSHAVVVSPAYADAFTGGDPEPAPGDCYAKRNDVCDNPSVVCTDSECTKTLLINQGFQYTCPGSAEQESSNANGYKYVAKVIWEDPGKTRFKEIEKIKCIAVFKCTHAGTTVLVTLANEKIGIQPSNCFKKADGKYYCNSGTAGAAVGYRGEHKQFVPDDFADDCIKPKANPGDGQQRRLPR